MKTKKSIISILLIACLLIAVLLFFQRSTPFSKVSGDDWWIEGSFDDGQTLSDKECEELKSMLPEVIFKRAIWHQRGYEVTDDSLSVVAYKGDKASRRIDKMIYLEIIPGKICFAYDDSFITYVARDPSRLEEWIKTEIRG